MSYRKSFQIFIFLILCLASQINSQTLQWRMVPGIPNGGRYNDLYFINVNTGWVITYDKIYKTTNGGINWHLYAQPGSNRSIGFFDSETGIVGTLDTARPLSITTNGGANWTLVSNFPNPKPRGVCGISIVDQNTAYISGNYYSTARAYKTTDKGQSWTLVFNDTSLARSLVDCYFWSPDSGLIVGGYNTSLVYNGNSVVLLTTNGGSSWQRVYKSTRDKEWCWKISFNSRISGVVSIEKFITNGLSYFLKTTNGGLNWTEIPFMVYDQQGIGFIDENTGWIGGYGNLPNDSAYETTNGGLSWHVASWGGRSLNRIRFINDTLAFGGGTQVWKYSRDVTGINTVQTEIPSAYKLYQNYPNPFNPITLIKFDIQKTAFVKLEVYDALGKIVRLLINEELNPGSYQMSFDGGYFPSGIYFYKLSAEDFIQTKRMILLK